MPLAGMKLLLGLHLRCTCYLGIASFKNILLQTLTPTELTTERRLQLREIMIR
jgi:hypothetical protein